ncbi:MAG: hypothetical protein M1818_004620 [Claussenomyces sp. TS43310]|nr:MAG: hypothetical protein M1818_004620 [Claussenomyces sp. TS43310]
MGMDQIMSIDKREDLREGSDDSMESEQDAEAGPSNQEAQGQPKRKGGRKPIYATSEERKQRNRQAQAAFRERRTEYIKQLEETIRVHETNLHSLQTAHRSAADECLMLRYKNSLLERILLEKGIDVQAELRAKTGSPSLGPTHMPQNMAQPPTVQRAIMNRHNQARRMNANIAPKIEPGVGPATHGSTHSNPSPQSRPTPTSHHSSPTSNSPTYPTQGVMTPPGSEPQMQPQRMNYTLKQQMTQGIPQGAPPTTYPGQSMTPTMKGQGGNGAVEQEYDAQSDMVDDQDSNDGAGLGPYPQHYAPQIAQNRGQQQQVGGAQQQQMPRPSGNAPSFVPVTQPLDSYDPMLDMDPFGLSASMHFPTQFSFDTSSMR